VSKNQGLTEKFPSVSKTLRKIGHTKPFENKGESVDLSKNSPFSGKHT